MAQPEACPPGTRGLGSSRPAAGAQNHTLTFLNGAQRAVVLYWVLPNATARPLARLEPMESRAVKSRTGDVWQAWAPTPESKPQLVMEHVVGPAEIRGDCPCEDVPLVLCPPRELGRHDPTTRPTYEPAGFANFAGGPVDVYVVGPACESKVASLQPGEQAHFASWATQSFRVRRGDDQRLLMRLSVGEVRIQDCGGPPERAALPASGGGGGDAEGLLAQQLASELAEHKRWARQQLERVTQYLVKERQRRDEEKAQLQARVDGLERSLASVLARLDGPNATGDAADGGRRSEAAAAGPGAVPSRTTGAAAGGEPQTVEVDPMGQSRWTAPFQRLETESK